jgi:CubicO group peptidase (beta-lactamase class C family)
MAKHLRQISFRLAVVLVGFAISASGKSPRVAAFEWQTDSPDAQGFSQPELDALQVSLAARNTKALLVIRNDRIVCEWYAPAHSRTKTHYSASTAKALVGGVALAVAIDDGLIGLDDRVSKFVPQWRDDPQKAKITIRQLGSHTSGLADAEDGDLPHEQLTGWQGEFWKRLAPPRDPFTIARDRTPVLFQPGTDRQYSNPGIAMLSYAVTVALKDAPEKDIRTLLRERVMRRIGVADGEWSCGYGQTVEVDGLPKVASWGGGGFTARAAARIGRLMLRQGEWDGGQIIGAAAVQQTTDSADLPGDGGMGWWTNSGGRVAALPSDAFWAAGAGGQVALVVPSLQLVAVRNGDRLDTSDNDLALDKYFFTALMQALRNKPAEPKTSQRDRHTSAVISRVTWAPPNSIIHLADGSDNWPMTWADDDALYTAYGDGRGFEPFVPKKLSLGLAKVQGSPPQIHGLNLRAPSIESTGDGQAGHKASGMLMVDGVLYLLVRNVGNAQLAWSEDRGTRWIHAKWKFTDSFGAPSFLNFGKNYDGSRDDFVYVFSHDAGSAYEVADAIVLARAPKHQLRHRDKWTFFAGINGNEAIWDSNVLRRQPVVRNPDKCYRSSASFIAGLDRYLLVHPVPTPATRDDAGKPDTRFAGGIAVYEAPEPWGPWTQVFATDAWDTGPGESCSFPTKWMSTDGKSLHLVFSGYDSFSVRRLTLTVDRKSPVD